MKILKIFHPRLGLCAQRVIMAGETDYKIMQDWRWKYGKKFLECYIEMEVTVELKEVKFNTPKPVMFIKTGDIYPSVIEASRIFDCSDVTIRKHCNRKLNGGRVNYRFKWAS